MSVNVIAGNFHERIYRYARQVYLYQNDSFMQAIDIQNQPDRYVISIAKSAINQDTLLRLLQTLQVEQLAQKIDFDPSILGLADELNTNWWQSNKHRFVTE